MCAIPRCNPIPCGIGFLVINHLTTVWYPTTASGSRDDGGCVLSVSKRYICNVLKQVVFRQRISTPREHFLFDEFCVWDYYDTYDFRRRLGKN